MGSQKILLKTFGSLGLITYLSSMKESDIGREDVVRVAKDLNLRELSATDVQYAIDAFDRIADEDPTGNLPIWIETALVDELGIEPPKKVKVKTMWGLDEVTQLRIDAFNAGRSIPEQDFATGTDYVEENPLN